MNDTLPVLTPDADRGRRRLEQCLRRLSPRPAAAPALLDGALATLCVVYLAAMAVDVARMLIR